MGSQKDADVDMREGRQGVKGSWNVKKDEVK